MKKVFLIWFIMCAQSLSEAVRVREYNGEIDKELFVSVSKDNEVIIFYSYIKTSNYSTYLRAFADAAVPREHTVFVTINDGSEQLEYMKLRYRDNTTIEHAESTIFPMFNEPDKDMKEQLTITVVISTESISFIEVKIEVRAMADFKLETNTIRNITISDMSSVYYLYKFDNETEQVNAIVDSEDEAPMFLSIQNEKSQVFDLAENVKYKGSYQTVTRKGSMVVQKSMSPNNSFIIVFVFDVNEGTLRKKSVSLIIKKILNQSAYWKPIITVSAIHIGLFSALIIWEIICYKKSCCWTYIRKSCKEHCTTIKTCIETHCCTSSCCKSACCTSSCCKYKKISDLSQLDTQVLKDRYNMYNWYLVIVSVSYVLPVLQHVIGHQYAVHSTGDQDKCFFNYRCARPLGIFTAFNNIISNLGYVIGGILFIVIVGVRQCIDKNCGCTFVCCGKTCCECCRLTYPKDKGIPKYYGLSYAMGIGLIMEGILSACYHICPNYNNFQFDMTYMYLLACICIVKLYQGRHPDIVPSATVLYISMAAVNLVVVLRLLWDGVTFRIIVGFLYMVILTIILYNLGDWTWFTNLFNSVRAWCCCSLHIDEDKEPIISTPAVKTDPSQPGQDSTEIKLRNSTCNSDNNYGTFSNHLSTAGSTSVGMFKDEESSEQTTSCKSRTVLSVFFFFLNLLIVTVTVTVTVTGVFHVDILMTIFAICVGNVFMYLLIYIIMKYKHSECYFIKPLIYVASAIVFWGLAIWYFRDNQTQWEVSPAKSRNLNRECVWFDFYDDHDIWHILSSFALFLSFLVIISIDDRLFDRERSQITVF